MGTKMDSAEHSLEQMAYSTFARSMVTLATPLSADIDLVGCRHAFDLDFGYDIRRSLEEVSHDVFLKGKAKRRMVLFNGDEDELRFSIVNGKQYASYFKYEQIANQPLSLSAAELGLEPRKIKRLVRLLRHSHRTSFVDSYDPGQHLKDERDRNEIIDRAGSFIPWTQSLNSLFTEPNNLIYRCDQKILAVRFCAIMQQRINSFFQSSGYGGLSIRVPVYPLGELEEARCAFIANRLSLKAFSDIVFQYD